MTTKFNHLLTGNSRIIYRKRMHGTVKCELVGVAEQQKNAKMLCAITQVSASDNKKHYLWDTMGYFAKDFNKEPIRELTGLCRHRPKWRDLKG